MVDKTIATINSAAPAAALDGTELLYGTQASADVGITTAKIKTLASASPTLVTPVLGVATATSINKMAITPPATSSTLAVADGKTATINNSLTLAGTDSTTMTFPSTSATIARTDAANTFTGHQTIEGVATTGATGTNLLVFATTPTLTTPVINGLTSSGSTSLNFSGNSGTFLTSTGTNTIGGELDLAAGTTAIAPLKYQSGTNLTSAVAGGTEFDGVQFYQTIDTTSGRGASPAEQYFHLTANGGAITSIANIFGATSNISLVASAYYIIDIYAFMVTTGTGATTYTFTNSSAPTSQNILWEMSPVTGIVAPPGTATMLVGQILNDATAARTIVTGSLSAATHYFHAKIWLKNGSGTSLKIQATAASTNTTPQIGSFWHARRISPNNIGTFAV